MSDRKKKVLVSKPLIKKLMTIEKNKGIVMILAPSSCSNVIATRNLWVTGANRDEMMADACKQIPGCDVIGIIERPQEDIDYFEDHPPLPFQPLTTPHIDFEIKNWHVYTVAACVIAFGIICVVFGH